MTKLTRLIREKYLNKGPKSSQPVRLGQSSPIIINPTLDQSRSRLADATKNPDEKDKTKAAASLTNPMWR
jgi:hypothetical protein